MKEITLKRIYEEAEDDDGYRILVDRIWPRGISKERAQLDEWNKHVAPSTELRKWFGHKPERFEEFKKKYKKELESQTDDLECIQKVGKDHKICILYGAKDEKHNQAVVLKSVLENL